MKKKILIVATVYSHIAAFHQDVIYKLKENNYEVHIAGKNNLRENLKINQVDKKNNVDFTRNPISFKNFKAYKEIKKILLKEKYDIIYCHTPAASVITRLAARKTRKKFGTKVIYMAHGFHFYKGAPIKNWLLYYPVEKFTSRFTDLILTINNEDYELAEKKFKKTKVLKTKGVGLDLSRFEDISSNIDIRTELNIKKDDFVILSVGELNDNKNQLFAIKAIQSILNKITNIKYLIAGSGPNKDKYDKYIKENNIQENIILLGYRRDIPQILNSVDLLISTSKREGLGINVIEGMQAGKVVLVSNIRGHVDIVTDGYDGFIYKTNDKYDFIMKLKKITNNLIDLNNVEAKAKERAMTYNRSDASLAVIDIIKNNLK